jgi:hypothetical protein
VYDDGETPTREREELLASVHDNLAATAELPVEAGASHYLGEAEALAADVADGDAPDEVVRTRLGHVEDLLGAVDSTGSTAADEHVAAAREAADRALALLGDEDGDVE